jgi:CBS domain-containing protein
MQSAGSIATKEVVHVAPDTMVTEAMALMSGRKISCLVVILQDTAVGLLTERDLVHAANKVVDFPSLQVREVMSSPILTIDCCQPVTQAYRLLKENSIRHLVVLDAQYDIKGVITLSDIVHKLHAEYFQHIPTISTIMTTSVKTVDPAQSARYALSLMAVKSISCVIVAEKNRPVGIFSERDAARLIGRKPDRLSAPISKSMSRPVETVTAAISPQGAAERMKIRGVRRLVVVNDEGRIAGLVTQSDISRVLESYHQRKRDSSSGAEPIRYGTASGFTDD